MPDTYTDTSRRSADPIVFGPPTETGERPTVAPWRPGGGPSLSQHEAVLTAKLVRELVRVKKVAELIEKIKAGTYDDVLSVIKATVDARAKILRVERAARTRAIKRTIIK